MKDLVLFISILIGKGLLLASRSLGRSGSALPGYIIEKFYPGFLNRTLAKLPHGVIIITGTNGKTTTTKIVSELLKAYGLRTLTNRTGSNFVRGIISTIVKDISLSGRLPYDIGVFEQDEAYAVHFVKHIQPRGVVILNIGRDQMDRYGEIDKTAQLLSKVVTRAGEWVVLNANDSRVRALADQAPKANIVWFGHSQDLFKYFKEDDQHYSSRPQKMPAAVKSDVRLVDVTADKVQVEVHNQRYDLKTRLDGRHNALNITAALAALVAIEPDVSINGIAPALATIEPAFGRGEKIILKDGRQLRLQLIKNPASFMHALRLLEEQSFAGIGIVINDDYADGRDVSWLWDVDFRSLQRQKSPIICGGSRAYDMALRLKYDEVPYQETTTKNTDFLKKLLALGGKQNGAMLFCTYTAMLQLRQLLKKEARQMSREGI